MCKCFSFLTQKPVTAACPMHCSGRPLGMSKHLFICAYIWLVLCYWNFRMSRWAVTELKSRKLNRKQLLRHPGHSSDTASLLAISLRYPVHGLVSGSAGAVTSHDQPDQNTLSSLWAACPSLPKRFYSIVRGTEGVHGRSLMTGWCWWDFYPLCLRAVLSHSQCTEKQSRLIP